MSSLNKPNPIQTLYILTYLIQNYFLCLGRHDFNKQRSYIGRQASCLVLRHDIYGHKQLLSRGIPPLNLVKDIWYDRSFFKLLKTTIWNCFDEPIFFNLPLKISFQWWIRFWWHMMQVFINSLCLQIKLLISYSCQNWFQSRLWQDPKKYINIFLEMLFLSMIKTDMNRIVKLTLLIGTNELNSKLRERMSYKWCTSVLAFETGMFFIWYVYMF